MRLTSKRGNYYDFDENDQINEVSSKLGQLEDIEDELGIDLIILFKAFKDGIWIKFNTGSRTYNYKTGEDKETGDQIVFHKAPYKTLAENIGYFRRLFEKEYTQNYGKTWALTKEELE